MTELSPAETLLAAADRIKDLAAAATNGPWRVDDETYAESIHADDGICVVGGGRWGGEGSVFNDTADARWIAALSPANAPMIETLLRVAAAEEANPSPLEYGSASLSAFMSVAREWARMLSGSGVVSP